MKKTEKLSTLLTILLLILTSALFFSCSSQKITDVSFDEKSQTYSCVYEGKTRNFILDLPEEINKDTSLIVMLHGQGLSAVIFRHDTHFEQLALPENHAVVYIDGTIDPNNKSRGKGWHYYQNKYSDYDQHFIISLAKYIQKTYSLSKKLFAVGFSNGGFMVNKLASTYSDTFTAVASVCGMMPKEVWQVKKIKKPVGYLQINGTLDDIVPMNANGSAKTSINPAIEDVLKYYTEVNKVSFDYRITKLTDKATEYDSGNKVRWILIKEGRHSWPEAAFSTIDATPVILDFFNNF